MTCLTLPIGRDTLVQLMIMNGNCDLLQNIPDAGYFDITNGGAAAAKAATSMTLTATPADANLYAGNYLGFRDTATGTEALAKVAADLAATGTALTTTALDQAIPANAVAQYPPRLGGRNTASVNKSKNTVSTLHFEDGSDTTNNATDASANVTLNGTFLQNDPGVRTMINAYDNNLNLYMWITLPNQDTVNYKRGFQWAFQIVLNNLTNDTETTGITTLNATGIATGATPLNEPLPV